MSTANEWKSIDVNSFFPESDDEIKVMLKCSTWSADGSRIICAARNAVFVSFEMPKEIGLFINGINNKNSFIIMI